MLKRMAWRRARIRARWIHRQREEAARQSVVDHAWKMREEAEPWTNVNRLAVFFVKWNRKSSEPVRIHLSLGPKATPENVIAELRKWFDVVKWRKS
jgi:hypothetical protein